MSEIALDRLNEAQVDRLRDQLRAFVAGATQTEQAPVQPAPCTGGSGDGHSSHCDNDGWV